MTTVQEAGWGGFKNGQLLKKISGSFETFITIDKRMENEHEIPEDVALITVRAPSNRIQDLRPLVPELLQAIKTAKPGRSTRVGRITRRPAAALFGWGTARQEQFATELRLLAFARD